MSRTRRSVPEWVKNRAEELHNANMRIGMGPDKWVDKVLQGRDGVLQSDAHEVNAKKPGGYDTWNTVGRRSKKSAKRDAAKAVRRAVRPGIEDFDDNPEEEESPLPHRPHM